MKNLTNYLNESVVTEGAWGYLPNQNDDALDQIDTLRTDYLHLLGDYEDEFDGYQAYAFIAVAECWLKGAIALDIDIKDCDKEYLKLYKKAVSTCLKDKDFVDSWDQPDKIKAELEKRAKIKSFKDIQF